MKFNEELLEEVEVVEDFGFRHNTFKMLTE